ncbi:hypothetical protein KUTeg_000923 [Tegillarca granosa]|uniref:PHD-type domain-containing protein n=1 Tax=Tegillarca granosa TaxID=220873 RepID=A0ABQ9FXR2_TEGGR|nr:hypothetical protein KUTeg_000923 [Tegillarca granosa]
MICSICRKDKSRKGKTNGATSGCAIRSCRKSFHYYCAKLDPVAVTKRMLVRYKNENREVVLYRYYTLHT